MRYLLLLLLALHQINCGEVVRLPCRILECDFSKVISPSRNNPQYEVLLRNWLDSTKNQLDLGINGQNVDVGIEDIINFVRQIPLIKSKLEALDTTYDKKPILDLINSRYGEIKGALQSALDGIRRNIDTNSHSGFTSNVPEGERKYMYRGLSGAETEIVNKSMNLQLRLIQAKQIDELANQMLLSSGGAGPDRDTFIRNYPEKLLTYLSNYHERTIIYIADENRIEIIPGSIDETPAYEYAIYMLQSDGTLKFGQYRSYKGSNKAVQNEARD